MNNCDKVIGKVIIVIVEFDCVGVIFYLCGDIVSVGKFLNVGYVFVQWFEVVVVVCDQIKDYIVFIGEDIGVKFCCICIVKNQYIFYIVIRISYDFGFFICSCYYIVIWYLIENGNKVV